MKTLRIIPLMLIVLISISCKENPNEPTNIYGDVFIIDTLEVTITYDETPGFKYPMMHHEIKTVARLTEKGEISCYQYSCESSNISYSSFVDYFVLIEPGYKFRYNTEYWSPTLLEPNSEIGFSLLFYADLENGSKTYTFNSTTRINHINTNIKPEVNAKQLTGPEVNNYNAHYSKDGQWIYYQNREKIYRTDIEGENHHQLEELQSDGYTYGIFEISDNNQLISVFWHPKKFSRILIKDLETMTNKTYEVHGYLWGSKPLNVPNTNKYLNLLDQNSSDFSTNIILEADIKTLKVDTLLSTDDWIYDYTINPLTKNLFVVYANGKSKDIIEYNFTTKEKINFINGTSISKISFFPNGTDFAVIKKDSENYNNIFLNIDGSERQLTTYPGNIHDFDISSDGKYILFSAERRGEMQAWRICVQ